MIMDQAEKLRNLAKQKENETRIITVASGKGGVGKSNFVVNLAIALKRKGKEVLIFDADMGMGNDDILMGIYSKYNLFDVIKGKSIEEVLEEGTEGVRLLSGGSRINSMHEIDDRERKIFLEKLSSLDKFDYILIDVGAGINKTSLEFISSAEELIIITTSEPTALTDAYSLLKVTEHFNVKTKIKMVVNRTLTDKEGLVTYSKFKAVVNKFLSMNLEYLGCIQEDRKLVESVRLQTPVLTNYKNSKASISIEHICERILNNKNIYREKKENIFSRIFNIFS